MITLIRVAVVSLIALVPVVAHGWQAPVTMLAQAPAPQEEFTPIDQLPPADQLPAAPLLVTAYAFVLLMLFGYVVIVSRRLTAIKTEVDRLDADVKGHGRR